MRGALEAEGFPVLLDGHPLSAVYGRNSGVFATRVLVRADDLPAARATLDDLEAPAG